MARQYIIYIILYYICLRKCMFSILYLNTYRGYFPCAIHYRKRPIYCQNVNIRIRIEGIQI